MGRRYEKRDVVTTLDGYGVVAAALTGDVEFPTVEGRAKRLVSATTDGHPGTERWRDRL